MKRLQVPHCASSIQPPPWHVHRGIVPYFSVFGAWFGGLTSGGRPPQSHSRQSSRSSQSSQSSRSSRSSSTDKIRCTRKLRSRQCPDHPRGFKVCNVCACARARASVRVCVEGETHHTHTRARAHKREVCAPSSRVYPNCSTGHHRLTPCSIS